VLSGILFVLKMGIPWEHLPRELGCGSGMTCWLRLRDWRQTGVWQALHEALLAKLNVARCCLLVLRGRCFGGFKTGPSPVDRRKADSEHHLITDVGGVPLGCLLRAANCNDVTQLPPLLDAIPPVRGKRGRPRRRPQVLLGDRGYDSRAHRRKLCARRITPIIAKREIEHGSGLKQRWVVERTISWLHRHRRLRVRHERRADIHEALLSIGCSLICLKQLERSALCSTV
jgi:transposase